MDEGLTPRQTRSYLMKRFAEIGIQPKTRYGQNFLIDLNLLRVLADGAELSRSDVVLEVGGGTGALTALLCERAGHVVSVEIDPQMHQLAQQTLAPYPNLTILHTDALKSKHTLSPVLLETVARQLEQPGIEQFHLAANLPYNIATPLISNLLLAEPLVTSMTVTIQKEMADRLIAQPATKDYGALSIWVQSQCTVEVLRELPPTVFWPRPKVDSAIVRLVVQHEWREQIPDLEYWHAFVRAMFFHRRKFLRSELVAAYKDQLSKSDVDQLLEVIGLDPQLRAEQLNVEEMLALCELFRNATEGEGDVVDLEINDFRPPAGE